MNLDTQIGLLRRRLHEVVADDFSDPELIDLINAGILWVQKEVLKYDPLAFIEVTKVPLSRGVDLYPKKQGSWWEMEVGYKATSDVLGYIPLEKKDYAIARTMSTGSSPVYCHVGRFYGIYPVPAEDVADGLRVLHVPSLTVAALTDVCDLHLNLHHAVVMKAQKLAMPELGDSQDAVSKELTEELADIPLYYQKSGTTNDRFYIDPNFIDRTYDGQMQSRFPNGVHLR